MRFPSRGSIKSDKMEGKRREQIESIVCPRSRVGLFVVIFITLSVGGRKGTK